MYAFHTPFWQQAFIFDHMISAEEHRQFNERAQKSVQAMRDYTDELIKKYREDAPQTAAERDAWLANRRAT